MKRLLKYNMFENFGTDKSLGSQLLNAAHNMNLVKVRELIDAGVDINYQDEGGCSALMLAVDIGDLSCVNILINAGINVNLQDDDGKTALNYAATKSHIGQQYRYCMKQLLEAGADETLIGKNKFPPIFLARDLESFKIFVKYGKNIGITRRLIMSSDDDYINIIDDFALRHKWLETEEAQRLIINKEPSLIKAFEKNGIEIQPVIKKELSHLFTGSDLNLL